MTMMVKAFTHGSYKKSLRLRSFHDESNMTLVISRDSDRRARCGITVRRAQSSFDFYCFVRFR